MKILRFKKKFNEKVLFLIGVLVIISTTFIFYRDLFNTFFTQDEWWELGRAVDAKTQGIGYYFKPWGGHVVPLMLFFLNLQFWLFGTNIWFYAAAAILGHALISITLALLVARLAKRPLLGWLSGFIFAVNTVPFHAVTYIAGGVTHIQGATFLFLISLVFFAKYLQTERKKYFWFSLISIVLGLAFMEYVAFYFFLVPVCYFLFYPRKRNFKFCIDQVVLIGLGIVFFIFRFLSQKIHVYGSQFIGARTVESAALEVNKPVFDYFQAVLANTAKLLPRVFYQVWMTEDMLDKAARSFKTMESFLARMPLYMVGLIIIAFLILYKLRQRFLMKLSLAAVLLWVMGAFPAYIFPTFPNVIPSRYLYLSSLGFSVLLALLLVSLSDLLFPIFKSRFKKIIVYLVVIGAVLVPFFKQNYYHISGRLKNTVTISKMRQKVLRQALSYYPKIKPKTVFYTSTNLNTPGIPWPVSLGYTMLVMHTYHGDYQGGLEFFRSNKLWPVSEGYEEHSEYGFGLYYDFNNLLKILKQYQLTEENVYAFHWEATQDSKKNLEVTHSQPPIYDGELLDITNQIRPIIKSLLKSDKYSFLEKQVAQYFSPDIQLSFDRSSEATLIDSRGLIEIAELGMPRITSGGSLSDLGVLIEGDADNLILFSEEIDNPVWVKSAGLKVEANSQVSPAGKKTAERLIFESKNDFLEQKVEYVLRESEKTNYTLSVYLKSPNLKTLDLILEDNLGEKQTQSINVDTSWRRYHLTGLLQAGGPIRLKIGQTLGEVVVWGVQLEKLAYPTTYIPSRGKPGFRAGDIFRAYPKESLSMSQGTVSIWIKPEWEISDKKGHIIFYNGESTSTNSIKLEVNNGQLRFNIMDAASKSKNIDYALDQGGFKNRDWNHLVATWSKGRMSLYLNGWPVGQVKGEGSGIPKKGLNFSDPHRIGVHHGWYSQHADAILAKFNLYPEVLTNNEILNLYNSQKSRF